MVYVCMSIVTAITSPHTLNKTHHTPFQATWTEIWQKPVKRHGRQKPAKILGCQKFAKRLRWQKLAIRLWCQQPAIRLRNKRFAMFEYQKHAKVRVLWYLWKKDFDIRNLRKGLDIRSLRKDFAVRSLRKGLDIRELRKKLRWRTCENQICSVDLSYLARGLWESLYDLEDCGPLSRAQVKDMHAIPWKNDHFDYYFFNSVNISPLHGHRLCLCFLSCIY